MGLSQNLCQKRHDYTSCSFLFNWMPFWRRQEVGLVLALLSNLTVKNLHQVYVVFRITWFKNNVVEISVSFWGHKYLLNIRRKPSQTFYNLIISAINEVKGKVERQPRFPLSQHLPCLNHTRSNECLQLRDIISRACWFCLCPSWKLYATTKII